MASSVVLERLTWRFVEGQSAGGRQGAIPQGEIHKTARCCIKKELMDEKLLWTRIHLDSEELERNNVCYEKSYMGSRKNC